MRAPENLTVEQTSRVDVRAVLGTSGDLIDAIGPYGTLSNDPIFNIREYLVGRHECSTYLLCSC